MTKIALYLAGGGARGAYQAGILKAISKILNVKKLPFAMVIGTSVGSLNAAIMAQYADNFPLATEKLEELWTNIRCENIFKTQNYDVGKSVLRNMSGLFLKSPRSGHLLDTMPLHTFIQENINFEQIKNNIHSKYLEAMEVISHCYDTQQTVSFLQHNNPEVDDWIYPRHLSHSTEINISHVLASTALPLFFPVIKIDGYHYGDGGMGLISPLRGATRFGMEKILILGTRQSPTVNNNEHLQRSDIGLAQILGNMLSGLFLDNLDRDLEMLHKMNEISRLISMWKKRSAPWKPIESLHLRPSADISEIAQNEYHSMPSVLRFMLNLLGAQQHSGDLLSFLLFEPGFTRELIELGYKDTLQSKDVISAFFA
jgi:NTE family protein